MMSAWNLDRGRTMHDLVIRNGRVVDGAETPAFLADIAIDNGKITAVGRIPQAGRREIDAGGLIVTPGWVDIHTHYDGQVTWDPYLAPSSWHGVTTAVMGNCGVGFAPVRPDRHAWLIELMEGVEDIPGAALAEGIRWTWETFPQYLDSLEGQQRVLDIATHVPHSAVRAYVMGERGAHNEPATAEDIEQMAAIVAEGMAAGALGFSTSRTIVHTAKNGEVMPGTYAGADELLAIGKAMGPGVFEMSSDMAPAEDEFAWMKAMATETGVTVTYSLLQSPMRPDNWVKLLELTAEARSQGAAVTAQIACRPTGLVLGWRSTIHPFVGRQTYRDIAALPFEERLQKLKDPGVRARILADPSKKMGPLGAIMTEGFDRMFRLVQPDGSLDYEPAAEDSIAAIAKRSGQAPDAIVYDMLMEMDGKGYIYLPLLNYAQFDFDHIHAMMHDP
ncbi:MAG: amidohydrolase family protein, partial [Phenylobacterium sp.]|nr:amidohydrolase family protein [Phenylobacterium sp.]